ncbi:MAG: hypothetical protein KatS3mg032_0164 [Cyclobacteriaceae bacterium]|nr:MAG: hypothetical protein KatS3mg032_0164 [Cyclobacteriaceae bacterium]
MKLHVIPTGFFKLDGGAMFGVVPKTIWQRTNPADENNLCTWAMRCLLVEEANRLILIDTGIGDKQDEKFFSHYYLHGGRYPVRLAQKSRLRARRGNRCNIDPPSLRSLRRSHTQNRGAV